MGNFAGSLPQAGSPSSPATIILLSLSTRFRAASFSFSRSIPSLCIFCLLFHLFRLIPLRAVFHLLCFHAQHPTIFGDFPLALRFRAEAKSKSTSVANSAPFRLPRRINCIQTNRAFLVVASDNQRPTDKIAYAEQSLLGCVCVIIIIIHTPAR